LKTKYSTPPYGKWSQVLHAPLTMWNSEYVLVFLNGDLTLRGGRLLTRGRGSTRLVTRFLNFISTFLTTTFFQGLIYVICVCLRIVVSNIYCVVFFVLFVFVLCAVYGCVQHTLCCVFCYVCFSLVCWVW
jgi:hypothetical protein